MNNESSSPTLVDVIFSENVGDGLVNSNSSSPTLTNVTFYRNTGHGIYNSYSSLIILTNVTIHGNGGGFYSSFSTPAVLTNCILWGDVWGGEPSEIAYQDPNSKPIVTYSLIQGGYEGAGNIDLDPLFRRASDGNLHLGLYSPAIDAGNNDIPELAGITTDLDGNPRFVDIPWINDTGNGTPPIVDMGAYEAHIIIYTNFIFLPVVVK
jgi:hypothetical protein